MRSDKKASEETIEKVTKITIRREQEETAPSNRQTASKGRSSEKQVGRWSEMQIEEDEDPQAFLIDLAQEASHRVYFGFFDLRLIDQWGNFTSFEEHYKNGCKKHAPTNSLSHSAYSAKAVRSRPLGHQSKERPLDLSQERTGRIDRTIYNSHFTNSLYRKDKVLINQADITCVTDVPHLCTLYKGPKSSHNEYQSAGSYR